MYLKSPYPPLPPIPHENVHHYMFNTTASQDIPDYTLHIDAISGRRRSWQEFRDRVYDGASALGAPLSQGGLGLDAANGDIVGIYSHNCLVDHLFYLVVVYTHPHLGLYRTGTLFTGHNDSHLATIRLCNSIRVVPCSTHIQGDATLRPAFASSEGFTGS